MLLLKSALCTSYKELYSWHIISILNVCAHIAKLAIATLRKSEFTNDFAANYGNLSYEIEFSSHWTFFFFFIKMSIVIQNVQTYSCCLISLADRHENCSIIRMAFGARSVFATHPSTPCDVPMIFCQVCKDVYCGHLSLSCCHSYWSCPKRSWDRCLISITQCWRSLSQKWRSRVECDKSICPGLNLYANLE